MADLGIVKFIGNTYVVEQAEPGGSCGVCIDSEDTTRIILMYFAKEDVVNARSASAALNLWAGFEPDPVPAKGILLVKN